MNNHVRFRLLSSRHQFFKFFLFFLIFFLPVKVFTLPLRQLRGVLTWQFVRNSDNRNTPAEDCPYGNENHNWSCFTITYSIGSLFA